jgi:hypothetical protein
VGPHRQGLRFSLWLRRRHSADYTLALTLPQAQRYDARNEHPSAGNKACIGCRR